MRIGMTMSLLPLLVRCPYISVPDQTTEDPGMRKPGSRLHAWYPFKKAVTWATFTHHLPDLLLISWGRGEA